MSKKLDQDLLETVATPSQDTIGEAIAAAPVFRASSHVVEHMTMFWGQTINERELMSIYALLAYVAHNQNVHEDLVQTVVAAAFGVETVAKIRRDDYERAIAFLVDLRLDELVN